MRKHFGVLLSIIFVAVIFTGWFASAQPLKNTRVEDFGLHDHQGNFHTLYYYSDASAIVLFIQGNGCPISRNAVLDLNKIRADYEPKGVVFLMLNANLQDRRADIAVEADAFNIDYPILVDETQLVAESLDLQRTGEAIVIHPATWKIIYRGPVDDRLNYETQRANAKHTYLADALSAHLRGEEIVVSVISSPGCIIALPNKDTVQHEQISYARDIAPILQNRCQNCHQEGGIGPWAMTSYDDVRGWAPMIREVIRTRRMPPWHADPHVGKFSNDFSLTIEEMRKVVHWIEADAPRGEGSDPLEEIPTLARTWTMGEPDLVVDLGTQKLPATGLIDYLYIDKELSLDHDVWVRAVEILPGNLAVVHHILASVIYPEAFTSPIETEERWLDGIFAAYVPGIETETFPEGTGRILPAGSKLRFQVHYTVTGRPETDTTKFGIYFSDKPAEKEFLIVGPANSEIEIPPGAKAYQASTERVFNQEVTLYGMFPHMHFRGKSMSYEAHYPDGSTEMLLSVPNYNFNWQRFYTFGAGKVLPAGTKIVCRATFDNSSQNPFNPDPTKTIHWGEQSFDEMLIGYMSLTYGTLGQRSE